MKIDEKMIELMTDEEQQELLNLIQKQQKNKKQKIAENLAQELREVINKMIDEELLFACDDIRPECFFSLDVELVDEDVVFFTFS